jgi:hypothetical protein
MFRRALNEDFSSDYYVPVKRFWLVLGSLVVVAVVIAFMATQNDGTQRFARLQRQQHAVGGMFAQLPLPPDAKVYTAKTQRIVELKRRSTIVAEGEFEQPGAFKGTDEYLRNRLLGQGWIQVSRSSVDSQYCRAPYLLTVEQGAWTDKSHRFIVRLVYDDEKQGTWKCAPAQ